MSEVKTIGWDIDGVLADFVRPFGDLSQKLHGTRARSGGAQLTWRFPLSQEEEREVWDAIDASKGRFWRGLKPLFSAGELDDMWDVHREGYAFVYITSRHSMARQATSEWLSEQQLPPGDLHMIKDKAAYLSQRMPPALRGSELVGFIDDNPQTARAFHAAGIPNYIRDWPYNREPGLPGIRVGSVGEYLAVVTGAIVPWLRPPEASMWQHRTAREARGA